MKRKELNSVAASLCAYLCSRNNDIVGYWGIGKLCLIARLQKKKSFSFKVRPGEVLWIYGYEISNSRAVTDKLVKLGLDSIEGRMSFLPQGQFPNGTESTSAVSRLRLLKTEGLGSACVMCCVGRTIRPLSSVGLADLARRVMAADSHC